MTTHTSITDTITGEVGRLSRPVWTAGRDFDFLPEESEPSGDDVQLEANLWGGCWSIPDHLSILTICAFTESRCGARERQ